MGKKLEIGFRNIGKEDCEELTLYTFPHCNYFAIVLFSDLYANISKAQKTKLNQLKRDRSEEVILVLEELQIDKCVQLRKNRENKQRRFNEKLNKRR